MIARSSTVPVGVWKKPLTRRMWPDANKLTPRRASENVKNSKPWRRAATSTPPSSWDARGCTATSPPARRSTPAPRATTQVGRVASGSECFWTSTAPFTTRPKMSRIISSRSRATKAGIRPRRNFPTTFLSRRMKRATASRNALLKMAVSTLATTSTGNRSKFRSAQSAKSCTTPRSSMRITGTNPSSISPPLPPRWAVRM
mmetsp:Transcript_29163/g.61910  ORF Transcript_29163/g.61910 Transcript_29163/m.61910 type:complete len:201 (+) Transcript_29163:910-1512(+)